MVRKSLSVAYKHEERFKLYQMDDAAEAFVSFCWICLICLKIAVLKEINSAVPNHPNNPISMFKYTVSEQYICNSCGMRSEPLSYSTFIWYVSSAELL
jgi:hypothetical protein